jgi:hypothetical protein
MRNGRHVRFRGILSSPGVSYNVLLSRLFDVELSAIFYQEIADTFTDMDLVIDKDLGGHACELEHVTDEESRHRRSVRAGSRSRDPHSRTVRDPLHVDRAQQLLLNPKSNVRGNSMIPRERITTEPVNILVHFQDL